MRLKLSIKIPSSSKVVITSKVVKTFGRALAIARTRIVPLVIDRASVLVDKQAPDFAARYKTALRAPGAVEVTEKGVTINIGDPVVKAVERGSKAFDMKPKLLAKGGKSSKGGGTYVDVVFKHKAAMVPQAIRTAGTRAAKAAGGAAEVRMSMKTEGRSFTRMLQRGSIGQALGIGAKKQKVQHKRGVHDDTIRTSSKTSGGRSSVSYTTIRRVSSRSASSSWWHPGFKARRTLDGVLPSVKRDVANVIRDAFSAVRSGS